MSFLSCAEKYLTLKKLITYGLIALIFMSTSCRVKKASITTKKIEKKELSDLHLKRELRNEIKNWLGTPYKYGGNTKKGVDCSGFVQAIYMEVYELKLARTSKDMYAASKPIKMKELREGDLIFFNYEGKGVSHVGIYLADNKYVHASASKGVVISDITDTFVKKKIVGAGRMR